MVLVECVWVLESVYAVHPRRIAIAVEMLLEHAQLVVQDPDVLRAALETYLAGGGGELSDCLILESARKAGHLPLGTFDRSLSLMDGAESI